MLLDCEKLGPLWKLDDAYVCNKKHFRAAAQDLWGQLDPAWNARDHEYVARESKLLHYSTLHTQPWRPFPKELRYRRNPHENVWMETSGIYREDFIEDMAARFGASRIVFGSGSPPLNRDLEMRRAGWAHLEEADRDAILGGNAARLGLA